MSSRPQQGAAHPLIGRLITLINLPAAWRQVSISEKFSALVRENHLTARSSENRQARHLARARSGSLTLNNPALTAASGVQHRDTGRLAPRIVRRERLGSSSGKNHRVSSIQPTRDSQRRGFEGARAPDNPLTIFYCACYSKLIA